MLATARPSCPIVHISSHVDAAAVTVGFTAGEFALRSASETLPTRAVPVSAARCRAGPPAIAQTHSFTTALLLLDRITRTLCVDAALRYTSRT